MTDTDDILALTRRALDEMDIVALDTTVRRTARIASLLGDSVVAVRLGLELKTKGGLPQANAEEVRSFMRDPSTWGDPSGPAEEALAVYLAARTRESDGTVYSHSVRQLLHISEEIAAAAAKGEVRSKDTIEMQIEVGAILDRITHAAFSYLCATERRLSYSNWNERIFERFRSSVDAMLATGAPDILDRFTSVHRRLREASAATPDAAVGEELAQAVASCRRILKAVADHVFPATDEIGTKGERLTDAEYRNRIAAFIRRIESRSQAAISEAQLSGVFERFSATDRLASKGVHAKVALPDAELCAISTYILAGEVLRQHASTSAP